MTQSLRIIEAFISREFAVFRYLGDDGWPTARCFDVIVAKAADGREFILPNGKMIFDQESGERFAVTTYNADSMLPKVQARGSIVLDCWVEMEAGPSFQERFEPFGIEWQIEQNNRGDLGGLYR